MAKLGPPIRAKEPEGGWKSWADQHEAESLLLSTLQVDNQTNNLTGTVMKFGRGDGYAMYLVTSDRPLTLSHLEIGDCWSVEPALIRGIRASDVLEQKKRDSFWKNMGSK